MAISTPIVNVVSETKGVRIRFFINRRMSILPESPIQGIGCNNLGDNFFFETCGFYDTSLNLEVLSGLMTYDAIQGQILR